MQIYSREMLKEKTGLGTYIRTLKRQHVDLHKDMKETARGMKTLGKVVEREAVANKMEVAALQQQKNDLGIELSKRIEDVKSMEEERKEFCSCPVALSRAWAYH